MPFINCKVELKLRWTNHFVLSVFSNDNENANVGSENIIFTIEDTKLYVLIVTLLTIDNQNLPKPCISNMRLTSYPCESGVSKLT